MPKSDFIIPARFLMLREFPGTIDAFRQNLKQPKLSVKRVEELPPTKGTKKILLKLFVAFVRFVGGNSSASIRMPPNFYTNYLYTKF